MKKESMSIYKRQNAVLYAKKYAINPNPKWGNYEKYGGDCTNFVSQCLYAGEIPFNHTGKDIMKQWYWYSDVYRTPSFTSANALKDYMLSKDRMGIVVSLSHIEEMEVGDIVQLGTLEKTTHSMLVTDVIYDVTDKKIVDVLVAQRSGIKGIKGSNIPLSSKVKPWLFFKILGYYDD